MEIKDILDSHTTFTIDELLNTIKISNADRTSFRKDLQHLITEMRKEYKVSEFAINKLTRFFNGDTIKESKYASCDILRKTLFNGMNCKLLRSDGKGWQKGQLKICFEFIPDDVEHCVSQEQKAIHHSPLDEIRNSIAVQSN